jgi:hypothetical protein
MRILRAALAAMFLCVLAPLTANAEPLVTHGSSSDGSDPEFVPNLDGSYRTGRIDDMHLKQFRLKLSFQGASGPLLVYYGGLAYGTSRYTLDTSLVNDLRIKSKLSSNEDVSIFGGLGAMLYRGERLRLLTFIQAEATPVDAPMNVDEMRFITTQGEFGLGKFAKAHSEAARSTSSLTIGTMLAVDLGWCTPELKIAIERTYTTITVDLDDEAGDLLRVLDYDTSAIERTYRNDMVVPRVEPGITLTSPNGPGVLRRGSLRLSTSFSSTGNDLFLGAGATVGYTF